MIGEAEDGKVSAETWSLFKNAQNYDADVASAREEGAMQGRNEKIQNKVKRSEKNDLPPTLTPTAVLSPARRRAAASGTDWFNELLI